MLKVCFWAKLFCSGFIDGVYDFVYGAQFHPYFVGDFDAVIAFESADDLDVIKRFVSL